jgi:predicted metal-dependent hydrolase
MGIAWLAYRKALRMLLKWEGLSRVQIQEETRRARKIRIPLFSLGFPRLFTYLKPGFHPNDLDDGGLGKQILAEQAARAPLQKKRPPRGNRFLNVIE